MRPALANLLATILLVVLILLMAGAVLALLPEQIEPGPGRPDCVTVSLPDRGMPDCNGQGGGSVGM